jgi:hypothetical protein
MKKLTIIILCFIISPTLSFSQSDYLTESLNDFQSRLNSCKRTIVSIINDASNSYDEYDIDSELGSRIYVIDDLSNDIEEFIDENNLKSNINFIEFQNKVDDYKSFCNNQTMECMSSFNDLINLLQASSDLVIGQKDDVNICRMKVGELYIYYAYGKYKKLYSVNTKFWDETNPIAKYTDFTNAFEFGLLGEIEAFSFSKRSLGKLVLLQVENGESSSLDNKPNDCQSFPRH